MKITKSRKEFINLYQMLGYLGELTGARFTYTISKNKEVLKNVVEEIQKKAEMHDNYREYEKERVELNEKYTKRDKDGNPEVKDKNYVIKDKAKFEEEVEKLKEKHKEAIEEREQQRKDVEELANKEITLDLKTIPLSIVPDKVTVDQMDVLSILIKD
jgi:polyribonucleotide nucleotidyltransferase